VFRVALKPSVNRVARVADGNLSDKEIKQEINERSKSQSSHREKRLAAGKEVNADSDAATHDQKTKLSIEIFLDIKSVMTARYTSCNGGPVGDGVIYE
jgi:hypothetical protein